MCPNCLYTWPSTPARAATLFHTELITTTESRPPRPLGPGENARRDQHTSRPEIPAQHAWTESGRIGDDQALGGQPVAAGTYPNRLQKVEDIKLIKVQRQWLRLGFQEEISQTLRKAIPWADGRRTSHNRNNVQESGRGCAVLLECPMISKWKGK